MTTQLKTRSERLEPALGSLLARVRRRIRAYIWADSLAVAVIVLGLGFWISLAFDWLFEPPRALRVALLVGIALALGYVLVRLLAARLLVRLADHNMAILVERRFGSFRDSLLTAVELADHPEHATDFNPEMLAHTHRDAVARARQIDLSEIFNAAPLVRRVTLAAALVVTTVVFAFGATSAFGVWARRTVLLSDELWPRQTHLLVEGFDDEGHAKIARGSDWNLVVKADAAVGREIPEIVEVRYSTTDGARGRENMSREGVVSPGQARFQNYAYAFKGVLAPLEFYVRGGDDRQGPFHLDVVESPTIGLTLHCEYPSYMHRTPRDMPMAGLMQVPRGTEIMIRAEANKPLVSAEVVDVTDENAPLVNRLELAQQHGGPQSSFAFGLQALEADKTLLFRLLDADGIRSRDAVRLALGAIPDEPPQVNVQVKGIGTAITPAARLPAAGEVSDDYGVTKIWFDYSVDDAPGHQRPFSAAASGQEKLAVADALEVRDLELQPKQKLHWAVQAADGCTLGSGPNVGTSQRYALEVVTPEQLRSMLEARELSLRRRFETIVEELTETRNLLARVTLPPVAKPSDDAAKETPTGPKDETPAAEDGAPAEQDNAPAPKVDASAQKDAALDSKNDPPAAQPVREAGSEPGDAAESAAAEATRRGAASLAVQVERVLQNGERSAHETLQVALAFDDIREEMINNRVDTEELKTRLKDGVADPLKRIVAEMFPKWEAQLKRLSGELTDPRSAVTAQTAALAQVDAILIEMQQVLDKMLELETFNEVLDMLRQIIDAQEKINAETKQKQKRKIRDLVE